MLIANSCNQTHINRIICKSNEAKIGKLHFKGIILKFFFNFFFRIGYNMQNRHMVTKIIFSEQEQ